MPINRILRDNDIDGIVNFIRVWTKEKLSWNQVCVHAELVLGYLPTRQGLSQHKSILQAFQAKKDQLRISPVESIPMPSSLAVASKRIATLNSRIAELENENALLRDRFIVWQYNSSLKMSQAELDRPLPEIDREVSKSARNIMGKRK